MSGPASSLAVTTWGHALPIRQYASLDIGTGATSSFRRVFLVVPMTSLMFGVYDASWYEDLAQRAST